MANIDEQELRSYLLGALTPERTAYLESLAQADESLREELLAIEEELVEQYLAGVLTIDESQSFERRILTTEMGQQKLHFAQLFQRYRSSNPAEEPPAVHGVPAPYFPPVRTSWPFFATFFKNPTFGVLAVFVACLLIVLGCWLLVAPSRQASIADERSRSEIVVPLIPDSTRSGSSIRHVTAPANHIQVKLELELTQSDFKKYKMQLFRENQALDSQEELKTESRDTHYVIPVMVTSDILTPGDYQLKLSGVLESGLPSFIDNYPFRVTGQDSNEADQRDPFAR
jgi:hypothetical protein